MIVAKIFLEKALFFVFVVINRLSDEAMRVITTKQHNFWPLLPKNNVQNVAAGFNFRTSVTVVIIFFPCMEIDTILLQIKPSKTIETSNFFLNWFLMLFKNTNPSTNFLRKTKSIVHPRDNCAPGSRTCIEENEDHFCREIEKFFVHAKCTRTHWLWTTNVPNKSNNAVIYFCTENQDRMRYTS